VFDAINCHDVTKSLLVLGPTGSGKTTTIEVTVHERYERFCAEVAADGPQRMMDFAYVTGHQLSGCRRRAKIGSEAPLVERACAAALLYLDEIGFEPPGEELFAVVDHRYAAGLPMVTCSGATKQQLVEKYGGAFVRRLVEPGGVLVDAHPRGQVRRVL
jgi:DNA replication protein DnaC